jgi:tubulin polyglutamylase TTLL5
MPGFLALTAKNHLAKTIEDARARLQGSRVADAYRCFPETFVLPGDYPRLRRAARLHPEALWIRKPVGSARGIGVELVEDLDELETGDGYLVQEYLARPHLLDGHKYTLRLYVLLTSVDPLLVYLFEEGFCKRASRPFSIAGEHLGDRFRHLTNPDVLRDDPEVPTSSLNMTLGQFRQRLQSDGIDDEALWRRLHRLIWATINAAREPMAAWIAPVRRQSRKSFELFGFDVLIDSDCDPWLIECNLSPSLQVEAEAQSGPARDEAEIKKRVVLESLSLVGVGEEPPLIKDGIEGAVERASAEFDRRGGFVPLRPEGIDDGWALMAFPRPSDRAVAQVLSPGVKAPKPRLRSADGVAFEILDDGIVVLPGDGVLLHLDPIGGAVWLGCDEGEDPETIAAGLQRQFPDQAERVGHEILDSIGGWCHLGLLYDEGLLPPSARAQETETTLNQGAAPFPRMGWNREIVGRCLDLAFAVRVPDLEVEAVLRSILQTCSDPDVTTLDLIFDVDRDQDEFVLGARTSEVTRSDDTGEITAELMRRIRTEAVRKRGGVAVISGMVASDASGNTLFVGFPVGWKTDEPAQEILFRGPWILHENGRLESIAGWHSGGRMVEVNRLAFAGEAGGRPESQAEMLRRLVTEGFTDDTTLNAQGLRVVVDWISHMAQ